MRYISIFLIFVLLPTQTFASDMPSLMCSVSETLRIPFVNPLKKNDFSMFEGRVYRLSNGKLYVNDFEKPEYFYADIKEEKSFRRYTAAYKTIIFNSDFKEAYVTHVSETDTEISKWICNEVNNK